MQGCSGIIKGFSQNNKSRSFGEGGGGGTAYWVFVARLHDFGDMLCRSPNASPCQQEGLIRSESAMMLL